MGFVARNFRDYKVWQESVAYASKIYKVTSNMPWFEKKGSVINFKGL